MQDWIVKYWLEALFGLLITILTVAWRKLSKRVKVAQEKNKAVELGLQALLRAQMIADFNHYSDKGWAPIYARESFENCWQQYEALGPNNVMQDVRNKFFALPTQPPKGE